VRRTAVGAASVRHYRHPTALAHLSYTSDAPSMRHRTLRGSPQGRIRLADHKWAAGTPPEDDDEVSIASFLTAQGPSTTVRPPTAILLSPPAMDRPALAPLRAGSSESELFAVGESGDEGARELPERVETGDLPTLDAYKQEETTTAAAADGNDAGGQQEDDLPAAASGGRLES